VNLDWRVKVLEKLSCFIPSNADDDSVSLSCDKWVASSALQKSIRRGDVELAQRAAVTFGKLDPDGLWRRPISIAYEDIGAADIQALIETVAAATSQAWRSRHGHAFVVQRLSQAPKDRSADLLMLAARHHDSLCQMREICSKANIEQRLRLVANPSAALSERAMAAWFSSGLDFRYEHLVGLGNLQGLSEVYRTIGVSEEFASATVTAARRTRGPLTVLVPLLWLEIQRLGGASVREELVPDSPVVGGLPLCALDEHTRLGKQAINKLVGEDARLRACLERFVPKPRWISAAQHAAFYADGAPIARRLEWQQSRSLEVLGIEADLGSAHVPREGVQPLRDAMHKCIPRLNDIRRELWLAARAAAQDLSGNGY
jgi:hypothetical protein